jgi:nifR3 family TIM-barrel protein
MNIQLGDMALNGRVLLAPMSGVTDLAFRKAVAKASSVSVVSEMVACEELVKARPDVLRRAEGAGLAPFILQLAGRDPQWMCEGAHLACQAGADIVDINMGCPSRQVTGGLSGSALMRDEGLAEAIIAATVEGSSKPVTLKMRLGWDDDSLNAPYLAARAEALGVQMITVHGRTRCQFYKGKADWSAVRDTVQAVTVPVIVNGDIIDGATAKAALAASGADGVMIGRAAKLKLFWPPISGPMRPMRRNNGAFLPIGMPIAWRFMARGLACAWRANILPVLLKACWVSRPGGRIALPYAVSKHRRK